MTAQFVVFFLVVVIGLAVVAAILASRGGDQPIPGRANMADADAEARAGSAGSDHLLPPSGNP
jgi:hypothetical protein